jgi:hypothetical protein
VVGVAEDKEVRVPARAVKAASRFVAEHGESGRAVVENVGRAGARVVLVGADGAFGDVFVTDSGTAEAVVAAVPELELAEWDRETSELIAIGPKHRRRMAGPLASRR